MKGYRTEVKGDIYEARDIVFHALEMLNFKIKSSDQLHAVAERGSHVASMLGGAYAGKSGRHVILHITCCPGQEKSVITFEQATSGISGGIIGLGQASSIYSEVYREVVYSLQNAGVLLNHGNL